jgi:hypothetical protein
MAPVYVHARMRAHAHALPFLPGSRAKVRAKAPAMEGCSCDLDVPKRPRKSATTRRNVAEIAGVPLSLLHEKSEARRRLVAVLASVSAKSRRRCCCCSRGPSLCHTSAAKCQPQRRRLLQLLQLAVVACAPPSMLRAPRLAVQLVAPVVPRKSRRPTRAPMRVCGARSSGWTARTKGTRGT